MQTITSEIFEDRLRKNAPTMIIRTFNFQSPLGDHVHLDISTEEEENHVVREFFKYHRDIAKTYENMDAVYDAGAQQKYDDMKEFMDQTVGLWKPSQMAQLEEYRRTMRALLTQIAERKEMTAAYDATGGGNIEGIRAFLELRRGFNREHFIVHVVFPASFIKRALSENYTETMLKDLSAELSNLGHFYRKSRKAPRFIE